MLVNFGNAGNTLLILVTMMQNRSNADSCKKIKIGNAVMVMHRRFSGNGFTVTLPVT